MMTSTTASTELRQLLDFAVDAANEAGEITLKYFQRSPETFTKSDGSFVTVADRKTEAYLREKISGRFPEDAIVGEEDGPEEGRSGRRWIIDPIDGTFAFVHGVPWDCAALKPILLEAGGTFTDWRGVDTVNGGNAISTNGKLFHDVMRVISATLCAGNGVE